MQTQTNNKAFSQRFLHVCSAPQMRDPTNARMATITAPNLPIHQSDLTVRMAVTILCGVGTAFFAGVGMEVGR
jgi:hypothetical protein